MKIDYKTIAIIVLSVILVWAIFIRTVKPINTYQNEIDHLNKLNDSYLVKIDSLKNLNELIDLNIDKVKSENKNLQLKNFWLDSTINKLKNEKTTIHTRVKHLDADSVIIEFTNYLEAKGI